MSRRERADWLAELWAEHVAQCGRCTDLHAACRAGDEIDWLTRRVHSTRKGDV